jgi:hypothetical protein
MRHEFGYFSEFDVKFEKALAIEAWALGGVFWREKTEVKNLVRLPFEIEN